MKKAYRSHTADMCWRGQPMLLDLHIRLVGVALSWHRAVRLHHSVGVGVAVHLFCVQNCCRVCRMCDDLIPNCTDVFVCGGQSSLFCFDFVKGNRAIAFTVCRIIFLLFVFFFIHEIGTFYRVRGAYLMRCIAERFNSSSTHTHRCILCMCVDSTTSWWVSENRSK